jgi:Putative amidase domain
MGSFAVVQLPVPKGSPAGNYTLSRLCSAAESVFAGKCFEAAELAALSTWTSNVTVALTNSTGTSTPIPIRPADIVSPTINIDSVTMSPTTGDVAVSGVMLNWLLRVTDNNDAGVLSNVKGVWVTIRTPQGIILPTMFAQMGSTAQVVLNVSQGAPVGAYSIERVCAIDASFVSACVDAATLATRFPTLASRQIVNSSGSTTTVAPSSTTVKPATTTTAPSSTTTVPATTTTVKPASTTTMPATTTTVTVLRGGPTVTVPPPPPPTTIPPALKVLVEQTGGIGVNKRNCASSGCARTGGYFEGNVLTVTCKQTGNPYSSRNGATANLWYQVEGGWIAAGWVTPLSGATNDCNAPPPPPLPAVSVSVTPARCSDCSANKPFVFTATGVTAGGQHEIVVIQPDGRDARAAGISYSGGPFWGAANGSAQRGTWWGGPQGQWTVIYRDLNTGREGRANFWIDAPVPPPVVSPPPVFVPQPPTGSSGSSGTGGMKSYPMFEGTNLREGPSTGWKTTGWVNKGDIVTIVCQYPWGEYVNGNNIWDKLSNGSYVTDYWVNTGYANLIPGVPQCAPVEDRPGGPSGIWSFSRSDAASYAFQHYNDAQTLHSDCTYFISQALAYGGLGMTPYWKPGTRSSKNPLNGPSATYPAFGAVPDFVAEMQRAGYATLWPADLSQSIVGGVGLADVVVYDWTGDGTLDHLSIVTVKENGTMYVSQHTDPRQKRQWNLEWSGKRIGGRAYLLHFNTPVFPGQ